MDTKAPIGGRLYLVVHQSREKWENLYPFLFFSSSKNGWLCIVCSEYGEGDEFWRTKGVKQGEHPNGTFFTHEKSKKHTKAVSKRAEVKRFFSKRNIYKQIYQGAETENQKTKQGNRRVIKKFLKTSYFLAREKWAVRENFEDVIEFLNDLGDQDINDHLRESSSRATYVSTTSTDEFLHCLSDHLEGDFLSRLILACDFSLMADETTDMADRAELSIFIRYVDSGSHEVKEEFLGLVEVVGSKGEEALFKLICEVLQHKGVDINQMRFNRFDGTNTMSGEISGLQR